MSRRTSKRNRSAAKPVLETTRGNTALALVERRQPDPESELTLEENLRILEAGSKANRRLKSGSGASRSFSLAWDETEAMGITADMRRSGPGMLSDQDRKETLYQAYLNSVWISACVDVIAKRITSGGMVIELTEKGVENQAEYDQLHELLHYINEDEDFLQFIRSIATDILIYGEAYMEIVRKNGVPYSLHKIDCSTMNYKLDRHGNVTQYIQNMTHSTETVTFEPDDVIRWWLPDPKAGKKALSPIERILGSIDADAHMADWVRAFFRKGARPPFWIKFPGSKEEASRFVTWLRENYTGQANAHIPMVLYDDAELHEIGKGAVDMDFAKGRGMMRQEILAGYQVPPAIVSQIESGNIGGGTGESQDKSFQFNACDPIRSLIFEKFNYRIINKGFGIKNWQVTTRYADFRSDDSVSTIQDRCIRNGSVTINEVRAETGKHPLDGGDEAVIVTTKEIQPISRLVELADEQRQQTQAAIQQAQAQVEMTKVQVDKAKNPPPPMLNTPQPTEKPSNVPPNAKQSNAVKQNAKNEDNQEDNEAQERYVRNLQHAVLHMTEILTRADEHLRMIRMQEAGVPLSQEEKQRIEDIWFTIKAQEQYIARSLQPAPQPVQVVIQTNEKPHIDTTENKTVDKSTIEEAKPAIATRNEWRPPSSTQLALEKDLAKAIQSYISFAKVTKDGVILPDETAHDQLHEALLDALSKSVKEGRHIALGTHEESMVSAAKNLAGRAVEVITDIVTQIKAKAQDLIDSIFGNDDVPTDDAQQVLDDQIEQWAEEYSDMVAQTEVHGAVEGAVLDEMQQAGVSKMRWLAEPDACEMCQHLAESGVISVNDEWQNGVTSPPLHPRCRCVVSAVNEDEEED